MRLHKSTDTLFPSLSVARILCVFSFWCRFPLSFAPLKEWQNFPEKSAHAQSKPISNEPSYFFLLFAFKKNQFANNETNPRDDWNKLITFVQKKNKTKQKKNQKIRVNRNLFTKFAAVDNFNGKAFHHLKHMIAGRADAVRAKIASTCMHDIYIIVNYHVNCAHPYSCIITSYGCMRDIRQFRLTRANHNCMPNVRITQSASVCICTIFTYYPLWCLLVYSCVSFVCSCSVRWCMTVMYDGDASSYCLCLDQNRSSARCKTIRYWFCVPFELTTTVLRPE